MICPEDRMVLLILVRPFGGLFHGGNAAVHFLARAVRNIEQNLGGIGHALDGSHHLVDGSGSLAYAGGLRLRALHHVLHVDAHLVHGAGDFVDGGRSLQADFCGFVRSSGHLIGSAGHLRGGVANISHQAPQPLNHARESIAQRVVFGARARIHGQISAGDFLRKGGHLFQIVHRGRKGPSQLSDFVIALKIDFVIEVACGPDLMGDLHQVVQRLTDRLR